MRIPNKDNAILCVLHTSSYSKVKQLVKIRQKRKSKGKKIAESAIINAANKYQKYVKEVALSLLHRNSEFLISVM